MNTLIRNVIYFELASVCFIYILNHLYSLIYFHKSYILALINLCISRGGEPSTFYIFLPPDYDEI